MYTSYSLGLIRNFITIQWAAGALHNLCLDLILFCVDNISRGTDEAAHICDMYQSHMCSLGYNNIAGGISEKKLSRSCSQSDVIAIDDGDEDEDVMILDTQAINPGTQIVTPQSCPRKSPDNVSTLILHVQNMSLTI